MLERINECLCFCNITEERIKKEYSEIMVTLFDKGYFPGLKGIPIVESKISNIDGEEGVLTFRGYPAEELAEHCSYEDVCYLLLKEDLPTKEQRDELREEFLCYKDIDRSIANSIAHMDKNLHPMYMLSISVLLLQGSDPTSFNIKNQKENIQRAIRLIAKLPTLIGVYRTKDPNFAQGKEFDSFAHYALYCLDEKSAKNKDLVDIFEQLLILHADHTINNSTFSVRAVGSSHASIFASISSAINSLSGPLHGGANEKVIRMLEEIGSPENVEAYIENKIAEKEKIMGIGHRVYKTYDPRGVYFKNQLLPKIFNEDNPFGIDKHLDNLYKIAQGVEEFALNRFGNKGIYPNVDFWSGLILKAMNIEPSYFTTIFALGRIMGWAAHWLENIESKSAIFRPKQLYKGLDLRHIKTDKRR
ncbi:citrate synthase [Orenia metallireducens]|jgi:citrate synthase|uniref:Citrate synthase n=1 Tax=Orenia metallireducens TaxID=1413210 RepID=A0A285GEI0_9FIRM|nr:citrate/2-methylcitrate synthase [Orenia metallireducens]PRX32546.1 citrate synthase [Orenia metallireducens]SNY20896.1 citrate synthase [Orenia metallireducens]